MKRSDERFPEYDCSTLHLSGKREESRSLFSYAQRPVSSPLQNADSFVKFR
jgi:hypothetical protein